MDFSKMKCKVAKKVKQNKYINFISIARLLSVFVLVLIFQVVLKDWQVKLKRLRTIPKYGERK
jgi:hypothetical protein